MVKVFAKFLDIVRRANRNAFGFYSKFLPITGMGPPRLSDGEFCESKVSR